MFKILVPVDFSEITPSIIAQTRIFAQIRASKVWLIHVTAPDPDFIGYDTGPQTVRDHLAQRFREEHRQIQSLATELKQDKIEAISLLLQGSTVETILEQAHKLEVNLMIMGCHGRTGLLKVLVGSVSEGVLRQAPCPVLLIPHHLR
jgi:nucleotide-binding universal stress UspA family protein